MNNDLIFGGKLIILGGDFCQILPVVRRAQRPSLIGACLKKICNLHKCKVLHLTTNMRVQNCLCNDTTTSQARLACQSVWLLQIGDGRIPNVQRQLYDDVIEIPQQFQVNSKEDLINHVYEDSENEEVDNLNNHIIQKFPGETYTLKSIDSVAEDQQSALYPPEFLNSLNISGMPPHIIKLKMGVPIMLLRNLDQRNGHCNGARYRELLVSNNMTNASKITGVDAGCTLFIPRIILQPSDTDLPFTLKRR
uniref:ATP-dependent DNA helicase n=1 Tax=Octopus bimaculoides TaxID=37653 RepID=A0A0L8HS58_OCTBM